MWKGCHAYEGQGTKSRGPLLLAGEGQGQAGCFEGSAEEGEHVLGLGGQRGTEESLLGKQQGTVDELG